MIFTSSLQVNAYFELLADIASMYTKVHLDHILPGIDLCDKMSRGGSDGTLSQRAAEIDTYTDTARTAILDLVEKVRGWSFCFTLPFLPHTALNQG